MKERGCWAGTPLAEQWESWCSLQSAPCNLSGPQWQTLQQVISWEAAPFATTLFEGVLLQSSSNGATSWINPEEWVAAAEGDESGIGKELERRTREEPCASQKFFALSWRRLNPKWVMRLPQHHYHFLLAMDVLLCFILQSYPCPSHLLLSHWLYGILVCAPLEGRRRLP